MSKHDHSTCIEHAMAWCRHCDVAYCQNCDIIWTRGLRWNLNQSAAQIPGVYYNAPKPPPPGLGVPLSPPYGADITPPLSLTGQRAHAHGGASDGGG